MNDLDLDGEADLPRELLRYRRLAMVEQSPQERLFFGGMKLWLAAGGSQKKWLLFLTQRAGLGGKP